MVALLGGLVPTQSYTMAPVDKGTTGVLLTFYPESAGPEFWFRMRAWDTDISAWEFWTSSVSPNPNPPSGHTVTGVTIIGVWEA